MNNLVFVMLMLFSLGSTIEPELDNIIMHDGYFYGVAKGQYEIVKLDVQGQIVARMGQRGRGPGEFSTEMLDMTFVGDTLHVYDSIGKKMVLLDPNLKVIGERTSKKVIHDILSYRGHLYISELRFPKEESGDKRSVKKFNEELKQGNFVIRKFESEKHILASYRPNLITVPGYSQQKVTSNENGIVVYYPYQSQMQVFRGENLRTFTLGSMENLALGQDRRYNDPKLREIYKEYPYSPVYYQLVKKVLWKGEHTLLLQVRSYKKGDKLLFYDTNKQQVIRQWPSPLGRLVGKDSTYYYFYKDRTIEKFTAEQLQDCEDSQLTFYISSFEEQCQSCKDSFFNAYEWVRNKNIPYRFVVKDPNWFGSPDEEDYREVIANMSKWDVWGAVRFEDECEDCFESGISVRVVEDESVISLSADLERIQSKISCMD